MPELTTNITNGNRINDEKSLHKQNANTLTASREIIVGTLHHTPSTQTLTLSAFHSGRALFSAYLFAY